MRFRHLNSAMQNVGGSAEESTTVSTRTTTNVLAVGTPYIDEGGITNSGAVFVYPNSADLSSPPIKLSGSNISGMETSGRYGASVGVTGTQIVVGYPYADNGATANTGQIFVYDYSNLNAAPTVLSPSDLGASAMLGQSVVCIESQIVVGARDNTGYGAVYVFDATDLSAIPIKLMRPGVGSEGAYEDFGKEMAVNSTHLFISAPGFDQGTGDIGNNTGAVWAYTLTDLTAAPTQINPPSSVTSSRVGGTTFGRGITADDDFVVIGALGDAYMGSITVIPANDLSATPTRITHPSPATSQLFGFAVAMSEDYIFVGSPGNNSNEGEIVYYNKSNLSLAGYLSGPGGNGPNPRFGQNLIWDSESNKLIMGVPVIPSQTFTGSVFEYDIGNAFTRTEIRPSEITSGDQFGMSIAVMGSHTASTY